MSSNDSPAILNASDLNDSFKSVSTSIPMTGIIDPPVLSGHPTLLKKKLGAGILLLLLGDQLWEISMVHLK